MGRARRLARESVRSRRPSITFGSEAEVLSFFGGGGLAAVSMASSGVVVIGVPGTVASLVCSGLAAGPAAVALAGLGGGHGTAAEPDDGGPGPCETENPVRELGGGPWFCC